MSFILDALKKSEADRQKKSTPGIADIPNARPSSKRLRWPWLVAGLLSVNLGVLLFVLLRPGADAEPASITRPIELPDTAPAASFSELVAEAKEKRGDAERAPASRQEDPAPAAASPASGSSTRAASPPKPQRVDVGSLVTFDELRVRGELVLPDLHLDLHVYGERPADRFVVVNMTRYKEGAALAEGPVVQQILPNGAVLEHQGKEFFLPRR